MRHAILFKKALKKWRKRVIHQPYKYQALHEPQNRDLNIAFLKTEDEIQCGTHKIQFTLDMKSWFFFFFFFFCRSAETAWNKVQSCKKPLWTSTYLPISFSGVWADKWIPVESISETVKITTTKVPKRFFKLVNNINLFLLPHFRLSKPWKKCRCFTQPKSRSLHWKVSKNSQKMDFFEACNNIFFSLSISYKPSKNMMEDFVQFQLTEHWMHR